MKKWLATQKWQQVANFQVQQVKQMLCSSLYTLYSFCGEGRLRHTEFNDLVDELQVIKYYGIKNLIIKSMFFLLCTVFSLYPDSTDNTLPLLTFIFFRPEIAIMFIKSYQFRYIINNVLLAFSSSENRSLQIIYQSRYMNVIPSQATLVGIRKKLCIKLKMHSVCVFWVDGRQRA